MVYYNCRVLIGLQAMVYKLIYHAPQMWKVWRGQPGNIAILWMFLIKLLLHSFNGYEIVKANSASDFKRQ